MKPVLRAGVPAGRVVRVASMAALACAAAATLLIAALRLSAGRSVLAYTEGVIFASVERLADGGLNALYPASPVSESPFVIAPYTPLFYFEWLGLRAALGAWDTLLPGRVLAFAALLACGVALLTLARRASGSWTGAAPFALAWVASPFVLDVAAIAVTDLPALAWSLAGLTVVARSRPRDACLAAPFFAAALLTKQSAAAGLLASAAHLAVGGAVASAAVLLAGSLGLALGAAALVDVHTGGGFAAAAVGGLLQPLSAEHLLYLVGDLLDAWLFWPLLAVALVGLRPAGRARARASLSSLYLFTSLALCLGTLGKLGSSTNYFLEPFAALCWAAAAGFARLRREAGSLVQAAVLAAIAAAALPNLQAAGEYRRAILNDRTLASLVDRELEDVPLEGWILSGVNLFPIVEARGGRPYLNDAFLYGVMWESGRWPAARLVDDLTCGRVTAVLPAGGGPRRDDARLGLFWEGWDFWNSPVLVESLARWYAPDRAAPNHRALVLRHRGGRCDSPTASPA